MMKNSCFLLLWCCLVALTVLNAKTVQCEELVDVQSWADFQTANLVSVSAVAEDCRQIFETCRADSQKVIDDLTLMVQSTDDAAVVPPKIWNALTQLNNILKNASKNVRFHFNEIGEHFLKRLDGAISIAKFKKFEKIQELQNVYNSEIDTTNESVLTLEKSFGTNYNPNSNLQQTLVESLKQETYSPSIAEGEVQQVSVAITEELDILEKSAIELLNEIYKGITVAKEVLLSIKTTGAYPQLWDEQYIRDHLQSCSFLAKALKIENDANTPKSPEPDEDMEVDSSADISDAEQSEIEDATDDQSGCGEVFRKTEKKIMKQLVIAIKEIKSMKNAKEIDSRTFKIFKNYSIILSNLNKKVISNVITVVNQFFQLYNIVLSILAKINPGMKTKANDILYITDVDTNDSNYISINKYIVEDYLSSSKMKEFHERIDTHVKSMKSLSEVNKAIVHELGLTTNELGQELQTMKSTIFYIFEEIRNGVKALQNLKNKSNITGFRYYLNFYKGKADLAQLTKLIHIINSLNIELLLERQLLSDEDELKDYELATSTTQSKIDQECEQFLSELNSMSDFNFVRGFVSKSVFEYNMLLQSYSVESRKTLKKVITKYVTIFEEIIIIIKRKKIKNAETFENLFNNEESVSHDETVSKYLLEHTNVEVEQLCSTLSQEVATETKEIVIEEIRELSTVTHTEVNKINEKVKSIIDTISKEIQNLKSTQEQVDQNVEYEISKEQSKCILDIIQLINSLQIKSSKDEIQSLNIYFERVKEKIQMAIQNFETQTTECTDIQQFKSQIESLKTSIYESLTKASNEIKEKIRRVIFEYNEKLYVLQKSTTYSEWNYLQMEESTFTLNENTRKYITGCYTSAEIFKNVDDVISAETTVDISQLKTDLSTQLDDTNEKIESELNAIHQDLSNFVQKFSEGMKVVAHIEAKSQKQAESVIEQAEWDKLKEVNDMVRVISKNVNILAESSERELKVQIDNARLQISKQCEQVSQTIASLNDNIEIETIINESISSCDKIYNELKNKTKIEVDQNIHDFSSTYEKIIIAMRTRSTDTQSSFLQTLHQENYKTEEDKEYQKFVQLMHQQDYQSTTTVADSFNYLKKYNFIDSQSIKEKSTHIFQSLSNKINIEIDNISYVSKYMLESVQQANKVLIQLGNSEKQSAVVSWNEKDLIELRKARSVAESWKYSLQDNTMSSISSSINIAKNEIDIEYKLLKSKIQSSNDESIIQTEVEDTMQKIENIYRNTQTIVNEKVQQSSSNFYQSLSTYIAEFQSSGSETLYTTMESILNGRNIGKMDKGQGVSQNVNFDIFSQSTDIREIYTRIETENVQESSDLMLKTNKSVDELKQVISLNVESLEKTSTYVIENIQKGFTAMTEIQTALQQDCNYQLTQYQEDQLRKCVSIYRKVENLNVSVKSAQERITKSIDLVKNEISHESTKVSDLISSLTDEKAVEETVTLGVNKFEQLYSQAKETVKEQLLLTSSKFYTSFTNLLTSMEQKSSTEVCKMMLDIKNGNSAYQAESDQLFMETISYFNSKSFKSCLTVKSWFKSIHTSTTAESHYSVNDRGTSELSSVSEKINSSLDIMQNSSTYVLKSIEKSMETLKQMEVAMKQNILNQLTEEQIVELQRCMSLYKSVQIISSSSSSTFTTTAAETIHTDISNIKNEISDVYSELTRSISSSMDENFIEEKAINGVKKFEQLYSKAKETVREELSLTLTSFYTSFSQISADLQQEANNDIFVALQDVRNSVQQSENDQSFQETVSYFSNESFKSCVAIKNWFKKVHSISSTKTNNLSEKTVSDLSTVNEQINNSLEKMEISSKYVLESVQQSTEILKQMESYVTQSPTFKLSQEQVTKLKTCMSIYQSIQSTVSTSTSTSLAQQTIQADINNVKEEIGSMYTQITDIISSLTEESAINETSTKGIEKFEQLFSQVKGTVKEQLHQISSSFYDSYTQISFDLQYQSNQQSTIIEENTYAENDQNISNMLSCFNSGIFKSNSVIDNWYREIHTSSTGAEYSYLSERIVNEFGTLNERITHSIESMQENSAYILSTIKKGSEILKLLEESTAQESTCELTWDQKTYLQKCVKIYRTIESIDSTSTFTTVSEAKQTIMGDISNVKNQIEEEFAKVEESVNSLSDESSIQKVATNSVNHVNEYFSQTKQKVQSQLKLTSSSFFNEFLEISSSFKAKDNQMSSVFSDIQKNENVEQVHNDQSYTSMLSYLTSDSFTSCDVIQNWYSEIRSGTSNSETTTCNERTINELRSLNERVTQWINSMEQSSMYVLQTIEKGSEILTQMKQSSANLNYQLNQDQIVTLQKCKAIYQNIQSITTTSNSTNITDVKQSVTMDISNIKSQINDEFATVSESIRSLTDESAIKETTARSVNNVDTYLSQTKEQVRSQLAQTSSSFYQKIFSYFEKQENEVKNTIYEVYQSENDQSFTNMLSYFTSDTYQSHNIVQTWYNDIQTTTVNTESADVSETTINQLNILNERVTKSINSIEENSTYVLDMMEKGSEILKRLEESSNNSNYQFSQEEISCLQKCTTIYQTISSFTETTTSSMSVSDVKQTLNTDITNAKSHINDEFSKISQKLSTLTDENSINEVVHENVAKVDEYYSQTRNKVRTQLTQTSNDFFTRCQQMTSISALQDIITGRNTYSFESDQSFTNLISYLKSDSYQTNQIIQHWYSEIHSNGSSSNWSENSINELNTLNERVTRSIDSMEENSCFILDTIERGSAILEEVQQLSSQTSSYQFSDSQIIDLQKCITICQTIQTTSTTTTSIESKSVSNVKEALTLDISSTKTQINDEFTKVSRSIQSLSDDEASIKQAINENVDKVEQYYGQTREKVQTELTRMSSDFFSNYQQMTTSSEKNEVMNVFQDIIAGKNTYQSDDETFTKVISYLNNHTFKSSNVIRNFYQEIQSSASTAESSYSADVAITELGTLKDRVTLSIDEMDENSAYILNTIEKGSEVLKQVQEKNQQNFSYKLTSEQIIDLQKCITIYQSIHSNTTTTGSTSVSNMKENTTANIDLCENISQAERTIETEVGTIKTQINDEYLKTANSIRSLPDESSINQVVDENVHKVENYYSNMQEKVQSQLTQTSSNFFSNYQQISLNLEMQENNVNGVLKEIINGETNKLDNDQSFTNVVSYLKNEAFTSNTVTQIYENIQSNIFPAEASDFAEQAVSKLGTLSAEAGKSVSVMEENSKYILNTMKKGSEVLKQVGEFTKQGSNQQLAEDQIIDLQKCITIYRIIQAKSSTNSITMSENEKIVEVGQSNLSDQNVDINSSNIASNSERSITEIAGATSNQTAGKNIASTIESNGELKNDNNEVFDQTANNHVDVETNISVEVINAEQKITTDVSDIKNQLNDEHIKVSQTISSLSDESSIKQAVDENVTKVDNYYKQAKQNVQSQLTQTSTGFYTSVQKVSENLNKQGSNTILQDVISGKNTYKPANDEEFINVVSYLNSDSFQCSEEIHTWYQEIQSSTTNLDTVNLCERSVDELNNLHDRVSASIDTMEQRSKYVLDTIKKGSEILKQVEEATKQDSNYELTQEQIIELQKCINIYQTIQSVKTTSTTTSNTVEVSNDSVSDQYMTSDDEYEYVVNVTTNTRQVVQVEETSQEESEISIIQNRQISEHDVIENAGNNNLVTQNASIENSNSSSLSSAVTASADSLNIESEIGENKLVLQDLKSMDSHVNVEDESSVSGLTTEINDAINSISAPETSLNVENNESSPLASDFLNTESEMDEIKTSTSQDLRSVDTQVDVNDQGSDQGDIMQKNQIDNSISSTSSAVDVGNSESNWKDESSSLLIDSEAHENRSSISQDINSTDNETDCNNNLIPQVDNVNNDSTSFETSAVNVEHNESSASQSICSVEAHTNTDKKDVLSEFDVSSSKPSSKVSNKSSNSSMKRTSHSSKIDLLKKFNQDQNTYSKTSLNALMVNWEIVQSANPGLPNTCESLSWENTKYCSQEEDFNLIKEIADLLSIGRSVIEHTINLKKEKLPLYRDVDEIELQIVSCTEIVDEILLQLSEVIGEDVRVLKWYFYEHLNQSDDILLKNTVPSLDEQFLTTATTFFSMKDTKKTDLLNQINKEFGNKQASNDDQAREIANQKFDKLLAIIKIVLDNIDCLVLRVVDTIFDAKNSLEGLQHSTDNSTHEKCYVDIKNGQVLCDVLKIPNN